MVFKLDRLREIKIAQANGVATIGLVQIWDRLCGKIEKQEATQDAQLALLLANQAATNAAAQSANTAQATADAAGGGTARSGDNTGTFNVFDTTWQTGPTVALSTVSAGNLTITGTGPTASVVTTEGVLSGEFRIVDVGTGLTKFTGTFSIYPDGTFINNSISAISAFSLAETSTGSVTYRLDARRTGGKLGSEADVDFYLFVRRS